MRDVRSRSLLAAALLVACGGLLRLLLPGVEPGPLQAAPVARASAPSAAPLDLAPVPSATARAEPQAGEEEGAGAELPASTAPLASEGIVADPWTERRLVRVRGLIVDSSGAPQAGARVELHGCQRREGDGSRGPGVHPEVGEPFVSALLARPGSALRANLGATRTGVSGRFEVVVQPGHLERIDLLVAAAEDADGAVALTERERLRPDDHGLLDLGRLELRPTARIVVEARAEGLALQGATVQLHGSIPLRGGTRDLVLEAVTNADGVALLRHQGRDLDLHVRHSGRAAVRRWLRDEGPLPATVHVEVDLRLATDVRGVVRDERGRPLMGVRLWAHAPRDQGLLGAEADTDEEGRFALPLLAVGQEYEVVVKDLAGAHVMATTTLVPPAPDLEVRLADAGSIQVTLLPSAEDVSDPNWARRLDDVSFVALRADPAAPGGWAPGRLVQRQGWDDEAGRARLMPGRADQELLVGLAPGTYRLHARPTGSSGWVPGEVVVRLGEPATVSVQLVPGRRVHGRLVDAAGRPLPAVKLECDYDLPELLIAGRLGPFATDAAGRFELKGLISEVKELTVRRDGFRPRRVKLGETADLGDVVLEPSR